MTAPAPFVSRVLDIEKEWIDYNGHLNMAYYNVLFDRGVDELFAELGMGHNYATTRRLTTYTAEIHVCYVRELHLGHRVTCETQLLDHDDKRFHLFQELRHTDGWLAATCENISLHIDMAGPKVTRFPPDILANVQRIRAAHAALPVPERAGRSIGIRRKQPTKACRDPSDSLHSFSSLILCMSPKTGSHFWETCIRRISLPAAP